MTVGCRRSGPGSPTSRAARLLASAVSDFDARALSLGAFAGLADRKASGFGTLSAAGPTVVDAAGRRWIEGPATLASSVANSQCLAGARDLTVAAVVRGYLSTDGLKFLALLSGANTVNLTHNSSGAGSGHLRAQASVGSAQLSWEGSAVVDLSSVAVIIARYHFDAVAGQSTVSVRLNGSPVAGTYSRQDALASAPSPAGGWQLYSTEGPHDLARLMLLPSYLSDLDCAALEVAL